MRAFHLALWGALLAGPAVAQGHPDLSGHWVLKDAEPADTAAAADSTAAPAGVSEFRPIVRRRGDPDDQEQLRRLIGMAAAVRGFRIAQSDTLVTITNDDGFAYAIHPGSRSDALVDGEVTIPVRSRWRGRSLEIEYRPPGGGRIIETYALADSGIFLRVEVVIEHDLLAQRLWQPRMYRLQADD
jgi:hypothetical protein